MRLSSIVSLVVVTASFALGGCAYGESADIGSEGQEPNVVHSHAGAPDQGRISDIVKGDKLSHQIGTPDKGRVADMIQVGQEKAALQIGKPAALPVGDIGGITGKLGFVPVPGSVLAVDDEGVTIPSLRSPGLYDPGMPGVIPPGQLAGIDLGRPGIPSLVEPGGALDPAMNVVPCAPTGDRKDP